MRNVLSALIVAILASFSLAQEPVRAGVAVTDITPPLGYRMSGYFYERLCTGIHDPLHAKALVLRQGGTQVALVFCDLVGVAGEVTAKIRRAAAGKTGIPAEHIAVMATHTHTGPLYFGALRKSLHDQAVAKHGSDPQEKVDYPALLTERAVDAIVKAQAECKAVELRLGITQQKPQISFVRRYVMKDGTVRWNPGQQNPDIVRPTGPIDPDVGMLWLYAATEAEGVKTSEQAVSVESSAAQLLATFTVFAMHSDTTGGTEYSADYPYYLEQAIQKSLGDNVTSLFGIGTCGNINDIDVKAQGRKGAEKLGQTLAATVLEAGKSLPKVDSPALAMRSRRIELPMPQYPAERIQKAMADMTRIGTKQLSFREEVETYRIADIQLRGGKVLPLEVQALRLSSDAAVVFTPGELFSELGLQIKRESPFKHTFVIELANEAPGYLPTRKAFSEGAYETINSRIESGGGEEVAETAIDLLKELAK